MSIVEPVFLVRRQRAFFGVFPASGKRGPEQGRKGPALLSTAQASCPDFAAGDLPARVSGGLGGEVVRSLVDDDRPAHHFPQGEPVGEEDLEGVAAVAEEGGQVPGVMGVGTVPGIVVGAHVGKGVLLIPGAGVALVDVEGEDGAFAGPGGGGQAADLHGDQNPPAGLIEPGRAGQVRAGLAAQDLRPGLGPLPQGVEQVSGSFSKHRYRLRYRMFSPILCLAGGNDDRDQALRGPNVRS